MFNAVFTISLTSKGFNLTCKSFNRYNKYGITRDGLYTTMLELTDIFNNVLNVGVVFEID